MSNPTSVVTERRLGAFYQEILPYLGGSADAGFTPVGSVIAIMGVTAPANYLACNGQIVNVADYPELANYFEQQFGTKYKFGGSGTTFGIPDLRGEFLRGTGTNSHDNQGNGASVGSHQDATNLAENSSIAATSSERKLYIRTPNKNVNYAWNGTNSDSVITATATNGADYVINGDGLIDRSSSVQNYYRTTRPTNTSVLWCIATKDIYLNPSMDYSTSEKVVGKWIDGKTLYQKTIQTTTPTVTTTGTLVSKTVAIGESVDTLVDYDGILYDNNYYHKLFDTVIGWTSTDKGSIKVTIASNNTVQGTPNTIYIQCSHTSWSEKIVYITLRYTKTT